MKKFTLILTSMLFLLVGGVFSQEVTTLYLEGGGNWRGSNAESNYFTSGYTYGNVQFDSNVLGGKWNGIGGSGWATTFGTNKTHRFTLTLNNYAPQAGFYFYILSKEDWNSENKYIIKTLEIPTDKKVISIDVNEEEKAPDGNIYAAVFIINLGSASGNATSTLDIASITRAEISASSVAAPTISPATGSTYDGDLSVTITKGEGNDRVVYSVSGSNEDVSNVEFTSAELTAGSKILSLTGTGPITVTATGYNGGDASSVVENTYTYNIPSGQSSTTSGLPHKFDSWGNSMTFNNSFFSNIKEGDYVVFNVQDVEEDGTVLGFRDGWNESPYSGCKTTSGGNGAKGTLNKVDTQWWMKVNSDVVNSLKSHEVRMQGGMVTNGPDDVNPDDDISSSVTLNSINVYECKALNESSDNSTALSSKINHVVVELTRSFVANMWNTVCLPFALTSDQATQLFGEGYQLTQFTSVSGTTMKFTTAASFVAGVPYLVKPTKDVSNVSPVVLVDVNITAKTAQTVTHEGDNGEYYSFVGNFTQKTFNGDNECNTSRFVATGDKLKKPNDKSRLNSLRCYFTVPAAATARSLTFDIDEEGGTTSINTVQGSGVMVNGYYNLAGQRVAQPTKGLYIVNGKKVVIK